MATAKIILYKSKKKSDGRYPVALRVIQDRKPKYSFIEWIFENDWDVAKGKVKKTHPNSKRINFAITAKENAINNLFMEDEINGMNRSSAELIDFVNGKSRKSVFFPFAQEYLDLLVKARRYTVASADKARIKVFKEFAQNDHLTFQEIDRGLLERLKGYLISERGVGERTVMNYYVLIRTLFNKAIDAQMVNRKYYPFGRGGIKIKYPDTVKVGLVESEIIRIRDLDLEKGTEEWHVRNQFLFSFYLAGVRISDVLRMKWQDIQDGRLQYKMGKNNKVDSLAIPKPAEEILSEYKSEKIQKGDYIFPELKKAKDGDIQDVYRKIRTANKKFNKLLKGIAEKADIDKPLTTHIARHSFGSISRDKIPTKILQKLYRHSSPVTTDAYQRNFNNEGTDDALSSVIDF